MRPQFPTKCYVDVNSPYQVIRHYTWKIPPFLLFLIYLTFDLHCRLCNRMFSTKQDLELKSRKSSGPPFFDLRESISRILYEHIKDPQVPQEVNFFIINYMVGSVSGEGRILCCYWRVKRERLATQAIKKRKPSLFVQDSWMLASFFSSSSLSIRDKYFWP